MDKSEETSSSIFNLLIFSWGYNNSNSSLLLEVNPEAVVERIRGGSGDFEDKAFTTGSTKVLDFIKSVIILADHQCFLFPVAFFNRSGPSPSEQPQRLGFL